MKGRDFTCYRHKNQVLYYNYLPSIRGHVTSKCGIILHGISVSRQIFLTRGMAPIPGRFFYILLIMIIRNYDHHQNMHRQNVTRPDP